MCKNFNVTISRLKNLQGNKSVAAFARHIGIPQKTLDICIKGERKPSVEIVLHVCARCGVSADWLLGLSDERDYTKSAAPTVAPVLPNKNLERLSPHSDADLLSEIRALKARVKALEDSSDHRSFACG